MCCLFYAVPIVWSVKKYPHIFTDNFASLEERSRIS